MQYANFQETNPQKIEIRCKLSTHKTVTDLNNKVDKARIIGCLGFQEDSVKINHNASGTWSAFNSLLSSKDRNIQQTNIALVPPLIRSPPTDYDTLYTGLMRARDITIATMGNGAITVMTLDLQLYDLAMKMWVENEDIGKQFLFRPGELHVCFGH